MRDKATSWARALALVLVLVGVARVVATHHVFSHTWAEPMHIAAGLELLSTGRYAYELQHPPLARVAVALGPFLHGVRSRGRDNGWDEGLALLYRSDSYDTVLTLARRGTLPFLVLTLLVTWLWTRRLLGEGAATVAVFLLVTLPPLLAHAGLATTDVALLGTCLAALATLSLWLETQTLLHGGLLGLTCALAVMSKFSAIPFLGVAAGASLLYRWAVSRGSAPPWDTLHPRALPGVVLGGALAVLTIWVSYGFALDFPRLIAGGIREVVHHNQVGHQSYLLGEIGTQGWWHYYPVALAVKTPPPLLLLGLLGLGLLVRRSILSRDWRLGLPAACLVAILVFSMTGRINIGVRHVLILYPLLALGAAAAVLWLWRGEGCSHARRKLQMGLVVGLLSWQGVESVAAHPDYLPHFNLFAGSRPERILMPSDLANGQDLKRLAAEVSRRGITKIYVYHGGPARLERHIPGAVRLPGRRPVRGWVAIDIWMREAKGNAFAWLRPYRPVMRVGHSIDLYHLGPDEAGAPAPDGAAATEEEDEAAPAD